MSKKDLQKEINERAAADQKARQQWVKYPSSKKWAAAVKEQDVQNTDFVAQTLEKHGWPTHDMVGNEASNNFWLLVQHADHNIELQEKALEYLKEAVANGQASKANLAYLTDRVLKSKGRKQLYGTQFLIRNKKPVLYKTKYKRTLDKRRKRMNLETVAESKQRLREMYKNILK